MPGLLFVSYLIVEIAALVAVVHLVGVLWTVVIVLASYGLGMMLVRSQGRRVLDSLRLATQGQRNPGGALADGALIGIGAILMFIPGLVTSVLGALLVSAPTRFLLRPLAVLLASRKLGVVTLATTVFGPARGPVIDGEVVEGQPRPHGSRAIGPRPRSF